MFGIVIIVAAAAAIVGTSIAQHNARLRVIEEAFRSLDGEPSRARRGIEGRLRGVDLHYLLLVGERRSNTFQTHCRATLPGPPIAFEMDLRPETRAAIRDVEHGRAIDLTLGDPAFDDTFIVEAAPAEMARALLDEKARTALLAFSPCRLTVTGNDLHFTKHGKLDELAEVRRVLELCSHVGSSLVALPGQLQERRLAQAHDADHAGYRGPTLEAIRGLRTTSQAGEELAALQLVRARRTRFVWIRSAAIAVAVAIAWLLFVTHR
jgi:hypothetical protein